MKTNPAAFITGGAVRLGRDISLHLARSGWDIALHYNSSKKAAEKTQDEIRNLGVKCELFNCDFSLSLLNQANFSELIGTIYKNFPRLSLLVNNASIYESATLAKTSLKVLEDHFRINFQAPFFLIQSFAKEFMRLKAKHDPKTQANIINILDNKISFTQYEYCAYLLSKQALAELNSMAALELAPQIRVNAIAPGVILPKNSRGEGYLNWRIESIPLQKKGAVTNLLLAFDYILANDFITGQKLSIDGGEGLNFTGKNFPSISSQ